MKIKRTFTVEVAVENKASFPFAKVNDLDGKKIYGVEAFSAAQVTKSPLDGSTVAAADIVAKAFVSFKTGEEGFGIDNFPVNALVSSLNNGVIKELDGLKLNLSKSKINIPERSELVEGTVIIFVFYYED